MSWQQQPYNPTYGQQWSSQQQPPPNRPSYNPAYSTAPPGYSAAPPGYSPPGSAPPPQSSWRHATPTYSAGGLPGGPSTIVYGSAPPPRGATPHNWRQSPHTYSAGGLPGRPGSNTPNYGAPTSSYGAPHSGYGSSGSGATSYGSGGSGYGAATSGGFGGPLPQDQELISWFKAVDNDNSGKITAIELREALVNSNWSHFNAETCRLLIGMFDRDGDGTINVHEFSALWKYVQDWKSCFTKFDRDGSGNIDARELQQALQSFGYQLSMDFCTLCTRVFDRNDKRSMKFDDFIQCCVMLRSLTEGFKKLDTDRNGVVNINYEQFLEMAIGNSIS